MRTASNSYPSSSPTYRLRPNFVYAAALHIREKQLVPAATLSATVPCYFALKCARLLLHSYGVRSDDGLVTSRKAPPCLPYLGLAFSPHALCTISPVLAHSGQEKAHLTWYIAFVCYSTTPRIRSQRLCPYLPAPALTCHACQPLRSSLPSNRRIHGLHPIPVTTLCPPNKSRTLLGTSRY